MLTNVIKWNCIGKCYQINLHLCSFCCKIRISLGLISTLGFLYSVCKCAADTGVFKEAFTVAVNWE